jgi:hypothetical protein
MLVEDHSRAEVGFVIRLTTAIDPSTYIIVGNIAARCEVDLWIKGGKVRGGWVRLITGVRWYFWGVEWGSIGVKSEIRNSVGQAQAVKIRMKSENRMTRRAYPVGIGIWDFGFWV